MLEGRIATYLRFVKHVLGINVKLFYGMWRLTRLPKPAITVFGGSRIKKDNKYSKQACELSKRLAQDGFSIITGGGPGIMEAANLGAFEHHKERQKQNDPSKRRKRKLISVGIGVSNLHTEGINPYLHDTIIMDHFFTRKWLLVRYSVGFVVFPGGFGTLDELFEIVTLLQTGNMQEAPIVLLGKDYWQPLIDWLKEHSLDKESLISKRDFDLISLVDTVDEAFSIISQRCKECLER